MKLYEIDNMILACIDEETGEILNEEMLENLLIEKSRKIENIALWYKNEKAEAEALKAEIKILSERAKRAEKRAESLKIYLDNVLGGDKFRTSRVSVSYRKSSSVEVDDVYKIPDEFLTYKTPEPKKTMLKEAINNGQTFEGVRIVEKMNIQIR